VTYPVDLWLANGRTLVTPGMTLECDRDADHGDLKTALARAGHWPTLPVMTRVVVESVWQNCYGIQVKCKAPSGREYDLAPYLLRLPERGLEE